MTEGVAMVGQPDSQGLIDRIIYLASLASKRDEVDPMLDTLREVTSGWDSSTPMAPEKQAQLQGLEQKLKKYLVDDDPVRTFSKDVLEKRLNDQAAGGADTATRNRHSFWFILGSSLLAAAAVATIPPQPFSLHNIVLFSIPVFFVVLHAGIYWFYFTALRNFTPEVRRAFMVITSGILVFAIAFSHYAIISAFELNQYVVLRYGGITWLVCLPFILIYLGIRMYAKQLHVQSQLLSLPLVATIAAGFAVLAVVLPHGPVTSEFYFDFWIIGATMVFVFGTIGYLVGRKTAQVMTPTYAKPMRWLSRYLLLIGPTTLIALAADFIVGELQGSVLYVVIAACGVAPQVLLLFTGYSFKQETSK